MVITSLHTLNHKPSITSLHINGTYIKYDGRELSVSNQVKQAQTIACISYTSNE